MTTEKPIKLKCGLTLPAGLPASFAQPSAGVCLVHHDSRPEPYRVRTTAAFAPPDLGTIQEAVCDGVCESVAGHTVEPDGWDHEGSPSWLLALGLI